LKHLLLSNKINRKKREVNTGTTEIDKCVFESVVLQEWLFA